MKIILITALLLSSAIKLNAQQVQHFTLKQCMSYAVEHNNSIKIQENTNNSIKQDKIEAVASLFPSLSASSSLTNSYGRSIDPETNTYTTNGYLSNYYSISASYTIFDGLTNINAVKAAKIGVKMGGQQLQQKRDETALSVMKLFYDALYYEESITITTEQLSASKKVLLLTQKQLELGIKSEADVALAMAEVANYDLLLTGQQNNLNLTILNLKEAMNFPLDENITLENSLAMQIQDIGVTDALEHNTEVLTARLNLAKSEANLKIARGNYLPTISLGAGYNTNYYKMLDATTSQSYFREQISDNYGYYIGASISIPIFQNLSRRSSVVRSKYSLKTAELQLNETEMRIKKAVNETLLQRESSLKEHIGAQKKIAANSLANRAMLKKYEQGMISIIDLQKSNNDLLIAKAEELRAKFNYQVQCVMVSYYNGEKLVNYN